MHRAFRYNLKLVLSLAADTKERIDRVESLIRTSTFTDDGYIQVGEEEKAKAYILNWYQSCNYNTLTIIDPYFKPQDLAIIKQLCDINNDLEIRILTHRQKYQNEDYTTSWRSISSGVTNTISLNFVWYDDNSRMVLFMTAIGYVLTTRTTSTKASLSAPSTASVKKKALSSRWMAARFCLPFFLTQSMYILMSGRWEEES